MKVTSLDPTDLANLDARAAAQIAALDGPAGHLAHDFNNLLAAISGSATLIELSEPSPEIVRNLRNIQIATRRAAGMMQQMLALSSRTDGTMEAIDVAALLKDIAHTSGKLLGTSHLISVFTNEDLPLLTADRAQVRQVVVALLENARDAMPAGGTIFLTAHPLAPSAARPEHQISISVKDAGTGMRPEVRAQIFQPFFSTKPKGRGTGLAMAIVLRVLQRHRGTIRIETELGNGSQVTCSFPLGQPAAE